MLLRSLIILPSLAQQIPSRASQFIYELEQFLVDIDWINEHVFKRPIVPGKDYAVGGGEFDGGKVWAPECCAMETDFVACGRLFAFFLNFWLPIEMHDLPFS